MRPLHLALLLVALASCAGTKARDAAVPSPNRDPKGEPNVADYIDRLQSPERLEDLQVDRVVETLALPADATVGDLGCGPGIFSLAFANACPRGVVYASDVEPAQLDALRAHVHATGLRNIVPVLASPDDPHFPPGRLDLVFVADTYHHIADRVEYMRRLASTLRPGGRLVLLEYKPGRLPVGPPPEHKLPPGTRELELREAGWTRVSAWETHPYHDFEAWRVVQPWENDER
jgi:SAM-dependent methyltransferase